MQPGCHTIKKSEDEGIPKTPIEWKHTTEAHKR